MSSVNVSTIIVAVPERVFLSRELSRQTGAPVAVDFDRLGLWPNHRRAWILADEESEGAEWCLVLQDDAELCDDFMDRARQALSVAPGPVVQLFSWVKKSPMKRARRRGFSWACYWYNVCGVAIAIRREYVWPMIEFCDDHVTDANPSYDQRVGFWAACFGLGIWASVPSLVQHRAGVESTICGRSNASRQSDFFEQSPEPLKPYGLPEPPYGDIRSRFEQMAHRGWLERSADYYFQIHQNAVNRRL